VQLGANLRHGAMGQAGNIVIPAYTVFDEDWSFADGHPTNCIVNLPNANVTAEKQRILFGSTVQGSDLVGQFYSKLCKLARLAGIDEQLIQLQFIHKLKEIKRYKTEQLSKAYLYSGTDKSYKKDNNSSGLGMTKTEIESLIKSMMPSIQEIKTQHFSRFLQWLIEEIPEFVPVPKPDLPPKPAIKKALRSNNLQSLEVTDNDSVEDMRKQLENLQINLTKMKKAMKKNSSKPKSSNHKTKTKSRTKKSNRLKHVNFHIISDELSSDSSDSENSTISSKNELETNTLTCSWTESESDFSGTSESSNSENDDKRSKKHKSARSKTSTKKSSNTSNKKDSKVRPEGSLLRNTRSLKIPTDNISLNAFFAILQSIVNSFTHIQPKEVSINGYNMINAEFIALKDPPNSIEINFIRKIIPNNVATITCQITSPSGKNIQVPGALIDSGANCSLKSKEFIETCYNVPITFSYGDNSCTITEDFPVMDDDKPWILLGTPLLDHAGWEPIVKCEFTLIHKDKVITIPLLVYKFQREIFKPEINLTFHKQNSVQVSTDSSSLSSKDNNVLLEEWHAFAGFSPDFSLSSKDDFLQSKSLDDESEMCQRLKAQLPQDFTFFLNHCEAGHFVSNLGLDSKSQCSAIKKK
ncbi:10896_t:CDS:2, partial [Cetraspora pellucida]